MELGICIRDEFTCLVPGEARMQVALGKGAVDFAKKDGNKITILNDKEFMELVGRT